MDIQKVINMMANHGYHPAYWLHDQDILGAWHGGVGAPAALFVEHGGFFFRDNNAPRDEQDKINVLISEL